MLQQPRWSHWPPQQLLLFRGRVHFWNGTAWRSHHIIHRHVPPSTSRKRIIQTSEYWNCNKNRFMLMMMRQYFHPSDRTKAFSTATNSPRRWNIQHRQPLFSVPYCRSNSTRRRTNIPFATNDSMISSAVVLTTRRNIGSATTTLWSTHNNSNNRDRPGTTQEQPHSSTNMGIFRLLNDAQRRILSDQQQLTAQVVRA